MKEELRKKFEELSEPLIEFLKENFHPHCTIIIDNEHAELLEGVIGFKKVNMED